MKCLALVKITVLSIFLLGITTAHAFEKTVTSGDNEIKITREGEPTVNSPIEYLIEVIDGNGNPVSGAKLKLEAEMPKAVSGDHGDMDMGNSDEPVIADAEETKPGHYKATLKPTMAGEWEIFIGGSSDTGMLNADFTEKVLGSGPNWVVIGTFIAAIVATGVLFTSRNRAKLSTSNERISVEEAEMEEA